MFDLVALAGLKTNTLSTLVGPTARSGQVYITKRRRVTENEARLIDDMYVQGKSTRYIAKYFGIGKTTVLGVLKRRGVELRPRGHQRS